MNRLDSSFFLRDVLDVAPELPGKYLLINRHNKIEDYMITEVEAYRGEEDKACHASKGFTARNKIMYHYGGHIYVYLIYGMYWMLNIVTGKEQDPQAVLIRSIEGYQGPGKLTKFLGIDGSFYGEYICNSSRIQIIDKGITPKIIASKRIGIEYAGDPWINMPWRFGCMNS